MHRIVRALFGLAVVGTVAMATTVPASHAAGTISWPPNRFTFAPQIIAGSCTDAAHICVAGSGFTPGGAVDVTSYDFLDSSLTPTSATDRVTAAPYFQLCVIGKPCGPQPAPGSFTDVLLACGSPVTHLVYAYDETAQVGIWAAVDPPALCL
jgi:hypothetical protein